MLLSYNPQQRNAPIMTSLRLSERRTKRERSPSARQTSAARRITIALHARDHTPRLRHDHTVAADTTGMQSVISLFTPNTHLRDVPQPPAPELRNCGSHLPPHLMDLPPFHSSQQLKRATTTAKPFAHVHLIGSGVERSPSRSSFIHAIITTRVLDAAIKEHTLRIDRCFKCVHDSPPPIADRHRHINQSASNCVDSVAIDWCSTHCGTGPSSCDAAALQWIPLCAQEKRVSCSWARVTAHAYLARACGEAPSLASLFPPKEATVNWAAHDVPTFAPTTKINQSLRPLFATPAVDYNLHPPTLGDRTRRSDAQPIVAPLLPTELKSRPWSSMLQLATSFPSPTPNPGDAVDELQRVLALEVPRLRGADASPHVQRPPGPTGMPVVLLTAPQWNNVNKHSPKHCCARRLMCCGTKQSVKESDEVGQLRLASLRSLARGVIKTVLREDVQTFVAHAPHSNDETATASMFRYECAWSAPTGATSPDESLASFDFPADHEFSARVRTGLDIDCNDTFDEGIKKSHVEELVSSRMGLWVASPNNDRDAPRTPLSSPAVPKYLLLHLETNEGHESEAGASSVAFLAQSVLTPHVSIVVVPWDRRGCTVAWSLLLLPEVVRYAQSSAIHVDIRVWCGKTDLPDMMHKSFGAERISMTTVRVGSTSGDFCSVPLDTGAMTLDIVLDHGSAAWQEALPSLRPVQGRYKAIILDHTTESCHAVSQHQRLSGSALHVFLPHIGLDLTHSAMGQDGSTAEFINSASLGIAGNMPVVPMEGVSLHTAKYSQDWPSLSWVERHTVQTVGDLVQNVFRSMVVDGVRWAQELLGHCRSFGRLTANTSQTWLLELEQAAAHLSSFSGCVYSQDAGHAWSTAARRGAAIVRLHLTDLLGRNGPVAGMHVVIAGGEALTSAAECLEFCGGVLGAMQSDGTSFALEFAKRMGKRLSACGDMSVLEAPVVKSIIAKLITSIRACSADRGVPAHTTRQHFLVTLCERHRVHGVVLLYSEAGRSELLAKSISSPSAEASNNAAPLGCWLASVDDLNTPFAAIQPSVRGLTSVGVVKCRLALVLCDALTLANRSATISASDLSGLLHKVMQGCGTSRVSATWELLVVDSNDASAVAAAPSWMRHLSADHHSDCIVVQDAVDAVRMGWPAGSLIPLPPLEGPTTAEPSPHPFAEELVAVAACGEEQAPPTTLLVVPQWAVDVLHEDTIAQLNDAVVAQMPIFPLSMVSLRRGDLRMDAVCLVNDVTVNIANVRSHNELQYMIDALLAQASETYQQLYALLSKGIRLSLDALHAQTEWRIPPGAIQLLLETHAFPQRDVLDAVRDCVLRSTQREGGHVFELWMVATPRETGAFVQSLVHRVAAEPHTTFVDAAIMEAWVGRLLTPGS